MMKLPSNSLRRKSDGYRSAKSGGKFEAMKNSKDFHKIAGGKLVKLIRAYVLTVRPVKIVF